jgi:transposase
LHASKEELRDALTGQVGPLHRELLSLFLKRLELIESQMATLEKSIAVALQSHQDAVTRLVEIPGIGVDSAQQIIAEIGPAAAAFPSAAQMASWIGVCPGDRKALENPAATGLPKETVPCAGYWTSSRTRR